jgi:hypothetical protein
MTDKFAIACEDCAFDGAYGRGISRPCPDGCPTSVEESKRLLAYAQERSKYDIRPVADPTGSTCEGTNSVGPNLDPCGCSSPPCLDKVPAPAPLSSGEVRAVSKTGGAKGTKPAQYAMIPTWPLRALATLFGKGNSKYPKADGTLGGPNEQNWMKGYAWSYSISALMRHLEDWREGEKETPQNPPGEPQDPTAGTHPLIAVAWHCFTLYTFEKFGIGEDDRCKVPKP